jgi:hypothetical protein
LTDLTSDLEAFLADRTPLGEELAVWNNGQIHLRVVGYLTHELPPLNYVTSARAIVFRDDRILAFRDGHGAHILPGGRREPKEA